uniref:INTS8 TPR repeats domain-containing protein n=1 Tax=Strigamia maritima TaxID=126957 RepID=T1J245_STRMM
MENYDLQVNNAIQQPPILSWFEFLLNGNLLLDHVNKPNPDPTATELIEQFLSCSQNRETNTMPIILSGKMKTLPVETKKIKALKLLALKVAAHLNWNLNVLEDNLNKYVDCRYLLGYHSQCICLNTEQATEVKYHLELDYLNLTNEALIIRAMMLRNFPVKLPKSIPVPVPGQQNLSSLPMDNIVQDTCENSKIILNKIRMLDRDIIIPSINSFDIPTEMKQESAHEWSKGTLVPSLEIKCQICYDLGCIHFFNEDYSNAGDMFFAVKEFMEKLNKEFKFCCIEKCRLTGYLKACAAILKRKLDTSDSSVEEQLQSIIANQYKGLFSLLLLDNEKRKISLSYRQSIEDEILLQSTKDSKLRNLHADIALCNVVRTVLEGKPNSSPFFQKLMNIDRNDTGLLVKVVKAAFAHANDKQKKCLKDFVSYMCYGGNEHVFSLLFDHDLTKEFTENELESFHPEKHKLGENKSDMLFKRDFKGNLALQVGGLERDLLRSYDPKEIKDNFHQSRQLLDVAELEVAEKSFYLSKLIRWEAVLVDLLQDQARQPHSEFNVELAKKCKSCVHSLYQDKDIPCPEIIEYCVAYLLTVQQWDYLASCDFGRNSRFECAHFACILAKVCLEIRANSGSRKAVKELWELMLPIFTNNSNQQKRSSSGTALNQFMEKVQNILPLSVMISCLAKLHNILKDDSNNNIFLEYSTPWPAVVSNSGAFYIKGVCETLALLLNRTLQLFPNYPPFLKTMADLNYVLGYHAKCLKFYLEAGAASSDFFHYPVPRTIFDDLVYRRMIRCCSQLTYHTQAAVLCQFLDEVDYMVAFKALQEKNCSDAMDAYYNCFWDVSILEFLVNILFDQLKVMGQTELNTSNSEEIKLEAANIRKRQFLRSLTEQSL